MPLSFGPTNLNRMQPRRQLSKNPAGRRFRVDELPLAGVFAGA